MKQPMMILLGTAALLASGPAQAAQAAQCLTRDEAQSMIGYVLPAALTSAQTTCRGAVAAGGFMTTDMGAMIASYDAAKAGFWPGAKSAFLKLGGEQTAMFGGMSDEALRPLFDSFIPMAINDLIKPKDCGTIEQAAQLLAPLPPGNAAGLVALALALTNRDQPQPATRVNRSGARGLNLTICS